MKYSVIHRKLSQNGVRNQVRMGYEIKSEWGVKIESEWGGKSSQDKVEKHEDSLGKACY